MPKRAILPILPVQKIKSQKTPFSGLFWGLIFWTFRKVDAKGKGGEFRGFRVRLSDWAVVLETDGKNINEIHTTRSFFPSVFYNRPYDFRCGIQKKSHQNFKDSASEILSVSRRKIIKSFSSSFNFSAETASAFWCKRMRAPKEFAPNFSAVRRKKDGGRFRLGYLSSRNADSVFCARAVRETLSSLMVGAKLPIGEDLRKKE